MKINLPLAVDLTINGFSGGAITELESGITNGVIEKVGNRLFLTQRPSIDIFEDASAQSAGSRGRGIFYWDGNSALYIVNDGTLYKDSQSNSISTLPTASHKKCKFLVLDTLLIMIDAVNDEAFTISTSDTVTKITDLQFPPNLTPAVGLAHGGVVLDGYLFVLGENGYIYNSVLETAGSFEPLDLLNAERSPDGGAYLGKHHDNIVAFGVATIEFFYDAGNTTGSPLNRRQDVAYNTGCSDGESVWEVGDRTFFVSTNESGALGVHVLENFNIRKISNSSIESFLSQVIAKDGYSVTGSGFTAQGHTFYIMTVYSVSTDIVPAISLVYDDTTGLWGEWESTANGLTKFPIVDWTIRTGIVPRYGEGILSNGDLITINDNFSPQDTLLASQYVADDYVDTGYVVDSGAAGTAITLKARLGHYDGGVNNKKFMKDLRHVGNLTTASQNLIIRWADENNASFNTGRTIDVSKFQKITKCGHFRRRNHELEYAGTEVVRLDRLEGNADIGNS